MAAGSLTLFVLQLLSGTLVEFAALVQLYILVSYAAVRALGGPLTIGGFCVSMLALKFVVIAQVAKFAFWEPADTFLLAPVETMIVLVLGMSGLAVAGFVARSIRVGEPLLPLRMSVRELTCATWVFYVVPLAAYVFVGVYGRDPMTGEALVGGFLGVARQLATFMPFALVAATARRVVASRGAHTVSSSVVLVGVTMFLMGFVESSKREMFEPPLYYAVAAWAFGARFSLRHVVAAAGIGLVAVFALVPYAQVARGVTRQGDLPEMIVDTLKFAEQHLTTVDGFRDLVFEHQVEQSDPRHAVLAYYGQPMNLIGRMSLIKPVDVLVFATLKKGTDGAQGIVRGFQMMIPRALYPDKPVYGTGNELAWKIGMLAESDYTTQLTFGFIGESFSNLGWAGAFAIPLVLGGIFFLTYEKLVGSNGMGVWHVLLFCQFQHSFVEGGISALILSTTIEPVLLILAWTAVRAIARMRGLPSMEKAVMEAEPIESPEWRRPAWRH